MASVEKDTSLNLKIQPPSFLKKRIKELAGLILLALMALLSAAFFTYNASDRLEGWIEDQNSEIETEDIDDFDNFQNNNELSDDWIDNLDIDSFEEFNTMNKRKRKSNSTNERDSDPWI